MSNNSIVANELNKPHMAERQSLETAPAFNDDSTPQHQHFVNIPVPQVIDPNIDIIQHLNLPPIAIPPAAFQPAPAYPPSATPSAALPVQGSDALATQIQQTRHNLQESLAKLNLLAMQLNALNLINQQQQTMHSLQQYQTVYQQYNLEFSTSLLLSQCLQNLENAVALQTVPQPAVTPMAPPSLSLSPAVPTIGNKLETIEEGEDEEGTTALTPGACGGEMKYDSMELAQTLTAEVGEPVTDGADTEQPQIGEKAVNINKKPSSLEKIKRQIRGILNKITPENFDKLSQEIASILKVADIAVQHKKLQSLTDEQFRVAQKAQFKALIRLILRCILEKAVNEPLFSNQYARLCYSLYLYAEHDELKKKIFRLQLITLCHSVFKKSRASAESARFIGIVAMIGELFTYGLISWNVINSGIFEELLPPEQALDIEAICKLLKVSGHNFDKHHYKEINSVIQRLSKYAENFGFRTQCLVQDIYEMRQNEWKQRRDIKRDSPKTLEQIHSAFEYERKEKGIAAHQQPLAAAHGPSPHQTAMMRPLNKGEQAELGRFARPKSMASSNGHRRPVQRATHGNKSKFNSFRNNNSTKNTKNTKNVKNVKSESTANVNSKQTNKQKNANKRTQQQQARKKTKTQRPMVEFLKDVTLPDRTHYPANKPLTKTWAMRNSGEMAWGDNVELVYFKGDKNLSLHEKYPVINAEPEQEVMISADILTPSEPGRYCTYFRLQKNGKFFGPRVWVDIIVTDPQPATDGGAHCVAPQEVAASADHLQPQQLVECAQ